MANSPGKDPENFSIKSFSKGGQKKAREIFHVGTQPPDSNTPEMEKNVRRLGIAYYMPKPIDQQALKSIMDHQLKKQKGDTHG